MDSLNDIAQVLREKDNFLITSHVRSDGDSIGSQIAMGLILKKLGKSFEIINFEHPVKRFDFLPLFGKIRSSWKKNEEYDVAIILDCGKWSRIGEVEDIAKKSSLVINIDHHGDSKGVGHFNYINPGVSSTGEIIYSLLPYLDMEPDLEIATALYVSIITDTGRFRYSNTGPATHLVAARLLETGVSSENITASIMAQESPDTLRVYSEIRNTLGLSSSGKIAWYYVNGALQAKILAKGLEIESDRLFDELRTLKGYRVFLFFTEMEKGKVRASFRANAGIDVSPIARSFGGGGHPQACSCIIEGELAEVQNLVLEKLEMELGYRS